MQITNQKYYSRYSVAASVTHSTTVQGVNFLLLLKKIKILVTIYMLPGARYACAFFLTSLWQESQHNSRHTLPESNMQMYMYTQLHLLCSSFYGGSTPIFSGIKLHVI